MSVRGETPTITEEHVATASRPSNLRITDLRVVNGRPAAGPRYVHAAGGGS